MTSIVSPLFLIIAALISKHSCYDRYETIPDQYLDVVFMLDQSGSMGFVQYEKLHNDTIDWILSYYDRQGSSSSQFSVIYCCQLEEIGGIRHYFDDYDYATVVPQLLAFDSFDHSYHCNDNWDLCLNNATEYIFTEEKGYRKNATSIAVFISDCDFHMEHYKEGRASHENAAKKFVEKTHGKFVFLCATLNRGNYSHVPDEPGKEHVTRNMMFVLKISNQSEDAIIYHEMDVSFMQVMDTIVPLKKVGIFDCKSMYNCSEICYRDDTGNQPCYQLCNFTVYQWNQPARYGKRCNRSEEAYNEKLQGCNCSEEEFPIRNDQTETRIVKSSTWVVVLVIVIILVVAIAVLAVLLFVFLRRRKRKRAGKGQEVKKDFEKKGVGVDMSVKERGTQSVGGKIAKNDDKSEKSVAAKSGKSIAPKSAKSIAPKSGKSIKSIAK